MHKSILLSLLSLLSAAVISNCAPLSGTTTDEPAPLLARTTTPKAPEVTAAASLYARRFNEAIDPMDVPLPPVRRARRSPQIDPSYESEEEEEDPFPNIFATLTAPINAAPTPADDLIVPLVTAPAFLKPRNIFDDISRNVGDIVNDAAAANGQPGETTAPENLPPLPDVGPGRLPLEFPQVATVTVTVTAPANCAPTNDVIVPLVPGTPAPAAGGAGGIPCDQDPTCVGS